MLTKTLTVALLAGLLAYAAGALAHGPDPRSYNKGHANKYYVQPHGVYGNSGWSLSFGFGSSYRGYNNRYYHDRNYPGNRRYFYQEYHPGYSHYIPYHSMGPACNNYGYHRH